ncbi:hypothetical protein [Streptomyces sp. NPDC006971]|uniref:hypothetical protein n=1 Tax=Streptomyces sp. NPDC006971 TaxID=3154784 RepID=UPI0034104F2F
METDLAAVAVGVLAAALTGAATNLGQETVSAVVRAVKERMGTTPRGRAALAGLETAPDDAGARREAEAVLREEVRADPALQGTLAVHLNASASHTTGSVVINGGKVRGSQISVGPITVNKPNTTGGLLVLAAALLVAVALIVYGGVRLVGDGSPGDGGGRSGVKARALSVAETEQMMPSLTDLPGTWGTSRPPGAEASGETKCHQGAAEYEAVEGSRTLDLKVRFLAYACESTALAAEGYTSLVKSSTNPGSQNERPFPARKFGDESATAAYAVEDEYMADPSQVGQHLMSRARVGNVVIEMHYGPVRDEAGSEQQAEQLMRIMCDRAREAQAQG